MFHTIIPSILDVSHQKDSVIFVATVNGIFFVLFNFVESKLKLSIRTSSYFSRKNTRFLV